MTAAVQHHQGGRHAEAERLYRQVLRLDPEQPDALHLLGVLAYQRGRPDAALPLIERALVHRPTASAYHLNLGNVLLKLGRHTEARASYHRAAELDPADPEPHSNLGNLLVQYGQTEAGIVELRRAVELQPDHLYARFNLGNALRHLGRHEEAVAAYETVLRVQPAFVDALVNLGVSLTALERHDDALACFERALVPRPNDLVVWSNLAEALRACGRLDEAASWHERILAEVPRHAVSLSGLARIRAFQQRHADAAELLRRLVDAAPEDPSAHERLSHALVADKRPDDALAVVVAGLEQHVGHRPLIVALLDLLATGRAFEAGPGIRAALLAACADDTLEPALLRWPVLRIIWSDPGYEALAAAVRAGADPFEVGGTLSCTLVDDPVVLAALPRVALGWPDVERILTALRRSAAQRATAGETPSLAAGPLPRRFLCALARASFLAEYSWLLERDEETRVPAARAALCDALARPDQDLAELEDLLILVSLYEPLGRLPGARRLLDVPAAGWSPELAPLVREQVADLLEEQAIAAALPALTPIDNGISRAVRAMYEDNPYPRWRAARFRRTEPLRDRFRLLCPGEEPPAWPAPLPVLIAGAGSGQHPVDAAMARPETEILAIDLSRASLAYGARMARRLGVQNIQFAQADILALGTLDQQFALIECAGVLHHLENPLDGWRILRRLLRPDGLMRIGLYSERARTGIVAARELIARTHVPPSAEGIQLARRLMLSMPDQHPASMVRRLPDFYSMSGFRDLVMHVQEHRYTLPQLAEALDLLDLRFLGFDLEKPVMELFEARFPEPEARLDLACWDQFEAEHPDTFVSMYQFWCRPRR